MEGGTLAREIDDIAKRKKYKQNQYGDRKSRKDDYTGERVFSGNTKKAIKKHPIDKISDTDHVTPSKAGIKGFRMISRELLQIVNTIMRLQILSSIGAKVVLKTMNI